MNNWLSQAPRPSLPWFMRAVVWLLLASFSLTSFGQAIGPLIRGQDDQPFTGYTPNGTFVQGGHIVGNPHQILHDLANNSFWTTASLNFSNTTSPDFVHLTLGEMEGILRVQPTPGGLAMSMLSIGKNPYENVPNPLPNTASNAAIYTAAQQAADAGGYGCSQSSGGGCTGTRSSIQISSSPELAALGPAAFMTSPVFQAAQGPNGTGATGLIVSQSPDAIAHLAAIKDQYANFLRDRPIYFSQQMYTDGCGGFDNPCGHGPPPSAAAIADAMSGANVGAPQLAMGYVQDNGQAHFFDLATNQNLPFAHNLKAGESQVSRFDAQKLGESLRTATAQNMKAQAAVASIDFSYFKDDYSLFMQAVDLKKYVSKGDAKLFDDLLNGKVKPGDPEYPRLRALAEEAFRKAWGEHVEFNTEQLWDKNSAHWQAEHLVLSEVGDQELFQKNLDLFWKDGDPRQEQLLRDLRDGKLKPGDADYEGIRQLAEERFKLAYERALTPKKDHWFREIIGLVIAAVVTYFTAGALSGAVGSAVGSTATTTTAVAAGASVSTAVGRRRDWIHCRDSDDCGNHHR